VIAAAPIPTIVSRWRHGGTTNRRFPILSEPAEDAIPAFRPQASRRGRSAKLAAAQARHLRPEAPDRVAHPLGPAEEAIELALVERQALDLALHRLGDVGVLGGQAHVARQPGEGAGGEVLQAPEVVPPGVREVLVVGDDPGVLRPRHHPATTLLQERHAHLPHELVIHVVAHAQRQVDILGL
jgi:hypothetical protein